jgi:hypothetical protein
MGASTKFSKILTMNKLSLCSFAFAVLAVPVISTAADSAVPEQFLRFDPDSNFTIKYDDVDTILKTMVVDVGRSSRDKAQEVRAKTGTRMKTKVKVDTAREGNRFYFEAFDDNAKYQEAIHNVRLSLESIPSQVPLEAFNRKEQLAYWLNLYNITVLDQLVQIYPERNLKKEVAGRNSIFDAPLVTVSGVQLSLSDIQHRILATNYNNNALIMYGLYQGIIGGPNIRRTAYTGENVDRLLQDNAEEFVNSNRGTQARDDEFKVSSLYDRNRQYFPDFDADLKQHLMRYIEGPERTALNSATRLDPDIDDWTITDVYGTMTTIGGSFADNKAAMLDSVSSVQPADDKFAGALATIPGNLSVANSREMTKTPSPHRFSPDVLTHLDDIKEMQARTAITKEGTVTVEELGEAPPDESDDGAKPAEKSEKE